MAMTASKLSTSETRVEPLSLAAIYFNSGIASHPDVAIVESRRLQNTALMAQRIHEPLEEPAAQSCETKRIWLLRTAADP